MVSTDWRFIVEVVGVPHERVGPEVERAVKQFVRDR
jgi:hypothetical protein